MQGLYERSKYLRLACAMLMALLAGMLACAFAVPSAYAGGSAPITEGVYTSPWNIAFWGLDQDEFVYEVGENGEPIVRHPELMVYRGFKQLVPGVDVEDTQYIGDCCSVGSHTAHTWLIPRTLGGKGIAFNIIPKSPVMKSLKRSGKLLVAKWEVPQNMGAEQYDRLYVQVSTSSKFAGSKTIKKTIAGGTTEFTMSGMKSGKTYYFRIRGQVMVDNHGLGPNYAEPYDSKWSKVLKYKCR